MHGIIRVMLKRFMTSISAIFAIVALGVIHVSSPVVSASSHVASHSQHATDNGCKVVCQATVNKQKNRTPDNQKHDEIPSPYFVDFNTVQLTHVGVGLLTSNRIWLESSWIPPDLILLGGAYSTSL